MFSTRYARSTNKSSNVHLILLHETWDRRRCSLQRATRERKYLTHTHVPRYIRSNLLWLASTVGAIEYILSPRCLGDVCKLARKKGVCVRTRARARESVPNSADENGTGTPPGEFRNASTRMHSRAQRKSSSSCKITHGRFISLV